MYLQEPYAITSSSQRIRRRQSSRGYMIVGLSILCALLIIGTFITLFVIYFILNLFNKSFIKY